MNDPLCKEIIKQGELIQPNPEGLIDYQPQGKADQIIIK